MTAGGSKGLSRVCVWMTALSALGCDGYIGVQGRVYETAPSSETSPGAAYIDSVDQVLPNNLKGVSGCSVAIEPWTPKERAARQEPDLWTATATTDQTGFFKAGTTAKPGRYDATITVKCAGFVAIERVFRHDRQRHHAVVVLGPRSPK